MIERICFDVQDILASLARSRRPAQAKRQIIETDFAIMLTVANGEIVRLEMLEDSFAARQAVWG